MKTSYHRFLIAIMSVSLPSILGCDSQNTSVSESPPIRKSSDSLQDSSSSEPDNQPAKPTPNLDHRKEWLNESYNVTVRFASDELWREIGTDGKTNWEYRETNRTEEYIELFCPKRNYNIRIRDNKMELRKDGKWIWVANGHWVNSRNKPTGNLASAEIPKRNAETSNKRANNLKVDGREIAPAGKPDESEREKNNPVSNLDRYLKASEEFKKEGTLRSGGNFPVPELKNKELEVGKIGRIRDAQSIEVMQVVDENTVLASPLIIQYPSIAIPTRFRQPTPFPTSHGDWFFIDGLTNHNYIDGQLIDFDTVFEVTGTRAYVSADGVKRTVAVLEIFDMKEIDDSLKQIYEEGFKPFENGKFRKWTLKNDYDEEISYLNAKLISISSASKEIRVQRKDDGKVITISGFELSKSDHEYINSQLKSSAMKSKSAEEIELEQKEQEIQRKTLKSAFEQVPTEFRMWENSKTNAQFEAQLVGYEAGIVRLKKTDGTLIEESLVDYSVGDRKYVREEVEKRKIETDSCCELLQFSPTSNEADTHRTESE